MAKRRDPIGRFWASVEKTDGCWLWRGRKWSNGYGRFHVDPERGQIGAHVFSYELHFGKRHRLICHRCDVKACVRPDHLFEGSNADNLADMASKGRSTRGERNPRATLTLADVVAIKRSVEPATELARRFQTTRSNISNIRHGFSWRWV